MNKLTRTEALEKTRDMWRWLAEHPQAAKSEYFICKNITETVMSYCYLCEYVNQQKGYEGCSLCPLFKFWKGQYITMRCTCPDSVYRTWTKSKDLKDRTRYATAIADACEKELSQSASKIE